MVLLDRGCLPYQPQRKTLGTESNVENSSHVLSHLVAVGIKCVLVTPLEEGAWKLVWFPLDFAHVPFSFADFASYPFTVINHSCGYGCMLSSVSPPNNH